MSDLLARIDALLDTVGWVPVDQVPGEWKDGRVLQGDDPAVKVGSTVRLIRMDRTWGTWTDALNHGLAIYPTHVRLLDKTPPDTPDPTAALLRDARAALVAAGERETKLTRILAAYEAQGIPVDNLDGDIPQTDIAALQSAEPKGTSDE